MSLPTCDCATCRRSSFTAGHCVDMDGNWLHACPALVRAHQRRTDHLRAAGLLPGPDTITVNREALRLLLRHGAPGVEDAGLWDAADALRAALSEPPAPKEQQPPFDPDLELMANREGNRREVRAYRRDAEKEQP
jgi:hypothetical protein